MQSLRDCEDTGSLSGDSESEGNGDEGGDGGDHGDADPVGEERVRVVVYLGGGTTMRTGGSPSSRRRPAP